MACKRCGQCCNTVFFILGSIKVDADEQEFSRYVSYHRCDVRRVDLGDGGAEALGVKMPLVCEHLRYNPKTGLSSCAIYENRPKVCRDFLCEAAKEEGEK
jgi:Fe-S-cluster containining protein